MIGSKVEHLPVLRASDEDNSENDDTNTTDVFHFILTASILNPIVSFELWISVHYRHLPPKTTVQ
jgi:hypothetical protein